MTWVRFRVTLPPDSWLSDISQSTPTATYQLLNVIVDDHDVDEDTDTTDESGNVLLRVTGREHSAGITGLDVHHEVSVVDQLGSDGTETNLHVTARVPSIITAFQRAGAAFDPPITVTDGIATLEIAGQHDRVSNVGRELATIDPGYEVAVVGQYDAATRVLTDTQRELVLAAIDAGYYDTPRRCTLTALAERQGIAKSTCSETLQRAHERVMKRFAANVPTKSTPTNQTRRQVDGENTHGIDDDGISDEDGGDGTDESGESETTDEGLGVVG